jgi:hypothetical protein
MWHVIPGLVGFVMRCISTSPNIAVRAPSVKSLVVIARLQYTEADSVWQRGLGWYDEMWVILHVEVT